MNVRITGTTVIPIGDVQPYPQNPRRGDVDAIAESLMAHGQYKPIVVDRKTNYILAGSHTWQAMQRLKWSSVNVTYVDVDEETAKRIVLADNRTSDLASYDDSALLALLESLPDLDGTGFDGGYLDHLKGQIDGLETNLEALIGAQSDGALPETPISDEVLFKVGQYRWNVMKDPYDVWYSHHHCLPSPSTLSSRIPACNSTGARDASIPYEAGIVMEGCDRRTKLHHSGFTRLPQQLVCC